MTSVALPREAQPVDSTTSKLQAEVTISALMASPHDKESLTRNSAYEGYLATFLNKVEPMLAKGFDGARFENPSLVEESGKLRVNAWAYITAATPSDVDDALQKWEEYPCSDEPGHDSRTSSRLDDDLNHALKLHLTAIAHAAGYYFRFDIDFAERHTAREGE